jgi:type I restriction enzyme M protein
MAATDVHVLGSFVWSIAEILRGDFKQSDYGKVMLPFVVMRRLDCILEASKESVLATAKSLPEGLDEKTRDTILFGSAGLNIKVYNLSPLTFKTIRGQDAAQLHANLLDYTTKFSGNVRDIFLDKFLFTDQLKRLKEGGILWQVFDRFCQIDLHPDTISNIQMGYLFEDLIRRFSEISNETAGEHFTPREVIRLIVDLLLVNDKAALAGSGIIRTVYDPACGTGGMLALTEEAMHKFNPGKVRVELFGQELNGESFGICQSDMLVTGHDPEQIAFGNTLTDDAHLGKTFHYMLSNPPYGVDWKKYQEPIKHETEAGSGDNRFSAGLPRISDGQLLFLQHMISKMRQDEQGSRIGIVMNGSPLFTGGAASGESEIRRWMLENDWVEAIIALPTDLFYNTGIQTYVWMLTNRKKPNRRGKVQLIDASSERFWKPMRKSLGSKRREIPVDAREEIVRIYGDMLNGGGEYAEFSKIFSTTEFGYREIRVERPLRLIFESTQERWERLRAGNAFIKLSEEEQQTLKNLEEHLPGTLFTSRDEFQKILSTTLKATKLKLSTPLRKLILSALCERDERGEICRDTAGDPEPDTELRDHELVPLIEPWAEYFAREVTPFVPDAWVDQDHRDKADGKVGRVGYEINFARYFYKYVPPRSIDVIESELKQLETEISALLQEVAR